MTDHPNRSATTTPSGRRSRRAHGRIGRWAMWMFLAVVAAIMAMPFIWMVLASFRSTEEIYSDRMPVFPSTWRWQNYVEALDRAPFLTYAMNSFILAVALTASNVLLGSMCGYALAKLRFRGSSLVFLGILGSMMIPFYAIIIPEYLMVRHMPFAGGNDWTGNGGTGWIDTWWALIIPSLTSSFLIFLFRQFYLATPAELIESARIDGASEFRIYWQIITPLIKPGLLTVALLAFEGGWNNFLWPLLVTTSSELRTVQLGLSVFRQESGVQFNLLMAGTVLSAVPMLLLFLLFQRHFVNGFVGSGLK